MIPTDSKIVGRSELIRRFGRPRSFSLVMTNGCFDLLHPGHVSYLEEARALGDALVVAVNSDASVQRLKGPTRPLVDEGARLRVLAGLEAVDAVCLFDEDTPLELISAVLPDHLVKGGDYTVEQVVGRAPVEQAGGQVHILPFLPGYSTTRIVERIQSRG